MLWSKLLDVGINDQIYKTIRSIYIERDMCVVAFELMIYMRNKLVLLVV
jgi:hypothetical protein